MINYKEIENKVYNYPTKFKEGFTFNEIKKLLEDYPNISMKHFDNAMRGNTCSLKVVDDKPTVVNYFCDVYKAIIAGLEHRELTFEEFD